MQNCGSVQDTETAPGPIGCPAIGTGPVQLDPLKVNARPELSRATQKVGLPQDTETNPVPFEIDFGLANRRSPG
jgi:hypothetical protein